MRRIIKLILSPLLLWAGLAGALDLFGSCKAPPEPYAAVIVAGCRVQPDGSPSECLAQRTEAAVEAWKQQPDALLVFTGGVGVGAVSEARTAANHAAALGVPADRMLLEERSASTHENARFAAELLPRPTGPVLVVTDSYHLWRAERVFARHFAQVEGLAVQPGPKRRTWGALREVAAVLVYASRDWL